MRIKRCNGKMQYDSVYCNLNVRLFTGHTPEIGIISKAGEWKHPEPASNAEKPAPARELSQLEHKSMSSEKKKG